MDLEPTDVSLLQKIVSPFLEDPLVLCAQIVGGLKVFQQCLQFIFP